LGRPDLIGHGRDCLVPPERHQARGVRPAPDRPRRMLRRH
jgi:hypothetical protein